MAILEKSVVTENVNRKIEPYPRLRYMGSKYKVVPYLVDKFAEIPFESALDAFSGSGVVGYALKVMGKRTTSNDFLNFSSTVAKAVIENPGVTLDPEDVELILAGNVDGRDFIQRTFEGLYFPQEDHEFLDSAWSNIEGLPVYKKELAIAALCLASARKQPRGVFTITTFRYDDGRRNLRLPLRDLFLEAVEEYNSVVFDNGQKNKALCSDVFDIDPADYDLVYLDPPYAPPKDDNCYIKRYHFLEGLSVYWRGQKILENTKTKKLEKRFTPFSYKRTIKDALRELVHQFRKSVIVLSYSSNSVPSKDEILEIIREEKQHVEVHEVPHVYSFGTHSAAQRRKVSEYIFIAR
ncbi:DNA adenine methylase [Kroppenstedtia eburnea]|uniref:site-specific DNA-methyltransferase (adenine-specific) n=1 Tax=Kroppenstedtia eburnea TaxID=714067 RepID=A0A1N7LBZ3_9BACL|nr:DNA adenine methylase [Kroppenstedtia eburnea]SIS71324.1 DNA adenine methylase/adenine-specific DNA-methyltransferase [Kroppenstedtia eburnea]